MKKDFEKTYYKMELIRTNSCNERFPTHLLRNLALSDKIHEYIKERISWNKPVCLDVAAFVNDDEDSVTVVIGVPYYSTGPKTRLEEFQLKKQSREEW
jgi:hypothetical protein